MRRDGIGKAQLADAVGVGPSAVTKWAAGGAIRPVTLRQIALHFGVTVDWLLGEKEENAGARERPMPYRSAPQCRFPADCDLNTRLDRMEAQLETLTRLLGASLAKGSGEAPDTSHKQKAG